MTAGSGIVPLRKEAITTDLVCGNAKDRPGWARGPGRHGGWFDGLTNHGRLVRLAHDVGLDSLVLSYQEERTRKTAATDARHRAGQCRYDMPAGATLNNL